MAEFSRDQILAEIDRMCAHGALYSGSRSNELLVYLVDQTLTGQVEQLKSSTVALDIFERDGDFDPSINSLVRVEMLRLRRSLTEYAASPPDDAEVQLSIEKASYRVDFAAFPPSQPASKAQNPKSRLVMIGTLTGAMFLGTAWGLWKIGGLESFNEELASANCADARPNVFVNYKGNSDFVRKVAVRLQQNIQQYPLLSVMNTNPEACTNAPGYMLELERVVEDQSVEAIKERSIKVVIRKLGNNSIEWQKSFSAENNVEFSDDGLIAARIAYQLGNSNGVVPAMALEDTWMHKDGELEFRCLMSAHRVFIDHAQSPTTLLEALDCLGNTAFTSEYADNAAMLAALHFFLKTSRGKARFEFDRAEMERALVQADSIDPTNSELLQVKLRILMYQHTSAPTEINRRKSNVLSVIIKMQEKYPNEPYILGQLATSEAWFLDDPVSARVHNSRAHLVAPENNNLMWGDAYTYLATGDWRSLAKMDNQFGNRDHWYWILVRMKVSEPSLTETDWEVMRTELRNQGINDTQDVMRESKALGFGHGIEFHLNTLSSQYL